MQHLEHLRIYNDDNTTTLAEDITDTKTKFTVANASNLVEQSYIAIGGELMYIREISNETLTVNRGVDGTRTDAHLTGASVDVVNNDDNALVEVGDDFGFSEERFDFADGRTFSPSKGVDL